VQLRDPGEAVVALRLSLLDDCRLLPAGADYRRVAALTDRRDFEARLEEWKRVAFAMEVKPSLALIPRVEEVSPALVELDFPKARPRAAAQAGPRRRLGLRAHAGSDGRERAARWGLLATRSYIAALSERAALPPGSLARLRPCRSRAPHGLWSKVRGLHRERLAFSRTQHWERSQVAVLGGPGMSPAGSWRPYTPWALRTGANQARLDC